MEFSRSFLRLHFTLRDERRLSDNGSAASLMVEKKKKRAGADGPHHWERLGQLDVSHGTQETQCFSDPKPSFTAGSSHPHPSGRNVVASETVTVPSTGLAPAKAPR